MNLTESTFELFAAKHYDNPHCQGMDEFEEDLKRIMYVRKLLNRYVATGELRERLILNHVVILYNCFGKAIVPMLMMRLNDMLSQLTPFLSYINILPPVVHYSDREIVTESISRDSLIEERLRCL